MGCSCPASMSHAIARTGEELWGGLGSPLGEGSVEEALGRLCKLIQLYRAHKVLSFCDLEVGGLGTKCVT